MTDPKRKDDQGDEPLDDVDAEAVEDLDVDEEAEDVKGGYVPTAMCGVTVHPWPGCMTQ